MSNDLPEKVQSEIREFLTEVVDWAQNKDDLLALALVGSQAREEANLESDIDLLLLVDEPDAYLQDSRWVSFFGDVVRTAEEEWGKVTSIRVHYSSGFEVEFSLADRSWAAKPIDAGDKQVIDGGIVVLHEKGEHLSMKLERLSRASRSSSAGAAS